MTIFLDGSNLSTTGLLNSMTAKTATGTSVTFTDIPTGVKRVTFMLNGVSTSGTSAYMLQLGYGSSPTYQATGYTGESYNSTSVSYGANQSGIILAGGMSGSSFWSGGSTISLLDAASNTWSAFGICGDAASASGIGVTQHGYSVALSGVLTALKFTTYLGSDTFDAGKINILYE